MVLNYYEFAALTAAVNLGNDVLLLYIKSSVFRKTYGLIKKQGLYLDPGLIHHVELIIL